MSGCVSITLCFHPKTARKTPDGVLEIDLRYACVKMQDSIRNDSPVFSKMLLIRRIGSHENQLKADRHYYVLRYSHDHGCRSSVLCTVSSRDSEAVLIDDSAPIKIFLFHFYCFFHETYYQPTKASSMLEEILFVLGSADTSTSIIHHVVVAGHVYLQGEALVSVLMDSSSPPE